MVCQQTPQCTGLFRAPPHYARVRHTYSTSLYGAAGFKCIFEMCIILFYYMTAKIPIQPTFYGRQPLVHVDYACDHQQKPRSSLQNNCVIAVPHDGHSSIFMSRPKSRRRLRIRQLFHFGSRELCRRYTLPSVLEVPVFPRVPWHGAEHRPRFCLRHYSH